MASLAEAFALAQKHHRANELRRAEQVYRQIVRADAGNPQIWYLLGTVQRGQGKIGEAIASLQQAVWLKPNYAEAHAQLGLALADHGQLEEAVSNYHQALRVKSDDVETRYALGSALAALGKLDQCVVHLDQVIRLQPDHVDGYTSLGIALARQGKLEEAVGHLQQALRLRPDYAKAHNNLGVALAELGKRDEAARAWREAIRLKPDYAEAHFNLAVTLAEQRQPDEAITEYEKAIVLRPDYAEAYNNLGLALVEHGRHVEATAVLRQAIRLKPDYPEAYNNLGLALVEQGLFPETIAAYHEALRLRPSYVEAHNNFGTVLAAMGRTEEALAVYQQALWLRPDYAEVHWNRALAWLQQGKYAEGWSEYEWRWKRKRAVPRSFSKPPWDGSPLPDKTILLYAEQGMGDALMFIRYAARVKERCGTVVVECPEEMIPLLSTCAGIDRLVAEGKELPEFDVQAPLMSMPKLFGTTLETVPAQVPYLPADPAQVAHWKKELGADSSFKIGIAWQGNPKHRWDRHRSMPLALFEPLARLPGVKLYSLQKKAGTDQIAALRDRFPVIDLGSKLDDTGGAFRETAAAIQALDLVITCDTALAHLAGALGVRVWVLLSFLVDWRWMYRREDTPWYPSMRLFRQEQLGAWDGVFERVAAEVRTLLPERDGAESLAQQVAELKRRLDQLVRASRTP